MSTVRENVYTQDKKGNRVLVETREYEVEDKPEPEPPPTVEQDLAQLKSDYAALSAKVDALETKEGASIEAGKR